MSRHRFRALGRRGRSLPVAAVVAGLLLVPALPASAVDPDTDLDGTPDVSDCRPFDPAVAPGKPDKPDPTFEDTNCDGIDGDSAKAVFVSVAGSAGGLGTKDLPFNTIQAGINAAATALPTPKDVYLTGGNFTESLAAADGVGIYGGYAPSWTRGDPANITTVTGAPQALLADSDQGVVLQLLTLKGANTAAAGASSYGLRAINGSTVALSRVTAAGGDAGAGTNGATGGTGGNGAGFQGGAGGVGGCGSGALGAFGAIGFNNGLPGSAGINGANGGFTLADAAAWAGSTAGISGSSGGLGGSGAGGRGGFGASWLFGNLCGGIGGVGGRGGGGGGAGTGGGAGGGSFGAYLLNSSLVAAGSTLFGANAGAGGAGGGGGAAGSGTSGGLGTIGECQLGSCAGIGQTGFTGASGGQGGGGGGGAGGPSAGVYQAGVGSAYTDKASAEEGGNAGLGGVAGYLSLVRGANGQTAPVLRTATAPAAAITDFDGDGVTDGADACVDTSAPGTADGCPVRPPGDTKAPSAAMTAPASATTLPASIALKWTATDTAAVGSFASGVSQTDVRYRKAAWNGQLGAYVLPAAWQNTAARSATLAGALGTKYCFSTRAHDRSGNVSGWSAERCTARPLDDRSLVASTSGWSRGTGTAYFNRTITSSTKKGAVLTRTGVLKGRAALVATKCSTCGTVSVLYNGRLVKTVSLAATRTLRQQVVALPNFTATSGTVQFKVYTTGKSVQIDGFLTAR
jgi:hypothetical protein